MEFNSAFKGLKKKRKERQWWQRQLYASKQGSVQRFKYAGTLEFSVDQWVK